MYRPEEYRQRTEITGKNPLDAPRKVAHRSEKHELNNTRRKVSQISAASGHVGDPRNSTQTAQESGESTFYREPASMERAGASDLSIVREQSSQLCAKPRIRTLMDIFEASRRQHGEDGGREGSSRKRGRPAADGESSEGEMEGRSRKRTREGDESSERVKGNESQENEVAAVICALEKEFEGKERQSHRNRWCEPIPHERKMATVCEFYKAFHEAKTLPIQTCAICYRKFAMNELEEFKSMQLILANLRSWYGSQFNCHKCFASDKIALRCTKCIRDLEKGALSPAAHVHKWLRCEHVYPDELKNLSPVEEKLIALNSYYSFITKYNVSKGH
ncbi:hypothetical protein K469DRAFT_681886 [Zopfia rhizophila CBS 207.26]|uniref:Uncharacterized protein n=1 Tax=Zopfia rhizophila CBS 207.26 TaxID=1314779 RepID=A0A6A6EWL5_9PEZI|nr:hypothetical protein K469DRAFT_681886 [Zopfia rhizophila CBS 207.26]